MLKNLDSFESELDWDARNVVLTLARVWAGPATPGVHSKESAATWALQRLPEQHWPVLARALAIYRGETDEVWEDVRPRVKACADHLLTEIERERARAGPRRPGSDPG